MTHTDAPESKMMRQMANSAVALEAPEQTEQRRERLLPMLAASIEVGARRRRRRDKMWTIAAAFAAAAILVVTVGFGWRQWNSAGSIAANDSPPARVMSVGGSVTVTHAGQRSPAAHQTLSGEDELGTDRDGHAVVLLASGARVAVGASTLVKMAAEAGDGHEQVELSIGRVEVSVPKLGPEASFEVVTQHARVVVHGTRFSVEVAGLGDEAWTQVRVTEGTVAVHHASGIAMLGLGATWSSTPPAPLGGADSDAGDVDAEASHTEHGEDAAAAPASAAVREAEPVSPGPKTKTSSLAKENALFQSAMRAARRGDDAAALALLDQFLAKYPDSPLAPNARVERFRALTRLGRSKAAAAEARRYMAEDPGGFANEEARDVVMPPSSSGPGK